MKSYIINKLNVLKSLNKNLDLTSCIKGAEWIALSSNKEDVEKYIFLKDDKLLISVNGKSSYSKWNYLKINSSLVIENAHEKILFKIVVCNSDIIVLNIDSTNKYCFLINSKSKELVNPDYEMIQWYLIRKCHIDILSAEQRKEYDKEEEANKQKAIIEEKKKEEELGKSVKFLFTVLAAIIGCVLLVNSIQYIIEYKKLHPTIHITEEKNMIAVDLGLSVKWASCNVGANSPEEFGNYYGWGDPTGQDIYRYKDDRLSELYLRFPERKEKNPPLSIINTTHDIVKHNWGGSWRMPTISEIEELLNTCKIEYCEYNGVKCAKLTGPNGNFIYLPSAGFKDGDNGNWREKYHDYSIFLWSGEIYKIWDGQTIDEKSEAAILCIHEEVKRDYSGDTIYVNINGIERYRDLPVRGVMN